MWTDGGVFYAYVLRKCPGLYGAEYTDSLQNAVGTVGGQYVRTAGQRYGNTGKWRKMATRKCPFCAEEIQAEAIICRYCHSNLMKGNAAPSFQEAPGENHVASLFEQQGGEVQYPRRNFPESDDQRDSDDVAEAGAELRKVFIPG